MGSQIEARQAVFEGRILSLELQQVRLTDGRLVQQEVVLHRPCVAMVAVDDVGRVVLVRQYRAPAGAALLEVPAGSIDEGEDVEAAVQRELQEEIGARAGHLRHLGSFYVAPGYCSELMHVYLCSELAESRLPADDDELIEVERLSLEEAIACIASGEICDAKSVAGLLLYKQTLA